jgi:hypothetical protein
MAVFYIILQTNTSIFKDSLVIVKAMSKLFVKDHKAFQPSVECFMSGFGPGLELSHKVIVTITADGNLGGLSFIA